MVSPEIGESISSCVTLPCYSRFEFGLKFFRDGSPSMDGVRKLAVVFSLVYWSSQVPEAHGQGKLGIVTRGLGTRLRYISYSYTVHSFRLVSSLQF